MIQNKPDFIVPGFPKCGTTWLYDRLCELPDFDMPSHKELHIFNRMKKYNGDAPAGKGSHRNYKIRKYLLRKFNYSGIAFFKYYLSTFRSIEDLYLDLFNEKKGITGDITPLYYKLSLSSIQRISKFVGKTKIIFVLRDPIERCWSEVRKKLLDKRGMELIKSNHQEIKTFIDKKNQCNYLLSIDKYSSCFPKESIMITYYDVLKENPYLFLSNIVEFLGSSSANLTNYAKIEKFSNVAPKAEMPPVLYKYLLKQNKKRMKELAENYDSYCVKWYNLHYKKLYLNRNIDNKPFLIV